MHNPFIMLICMGGVFALLLAVQYTIAISDYLLLRLNRFMQWSKHRIKRCRDKQR